MSTNDGVDQWPIHVLEIVGNAIVGGMETYVRNLIRHLPRDQFRVTCLCPFESPFTRTLRQIGCHVFITPVSDDPPWRSIQLALEVIRHQHIDLIHAHMPKAHVLAGLASCLTQTPAIATVHGMNVTAQELGMSRATGTHLVVVCQAAYTEALALGMPPERVTLIPNGVDTEIFRAECKGDCFRKSLNLLSDTPLVDFVARIDLEKGPDQFVRVAQLVHVERPDVHFALVGEGAIDKQIMKLIRQMNLSDCVHMAGVWENPWDVYPALDILVCTSRSEGMPLALLEGMACGRPIVAMAVGGVPEVVVVGNTGLLLPPTDIEGMANAPLKLLEQPGRRQQMEQASRQRAEEVYDLRQSVSLISGLFKGIVRAQRTKTLYVAPRGPRLRKAMSLPS